MPSFTLQQLAQRLELQLDGDGSLVLDGLASLGAAGAGQLSHYSSSAYADELKSSQAGAVILRSEDRAAWSGAALIATNPYLSYARSTQLFRPPRDVNPGVHSAASVHPEAEVHPQAEVQAHAWVGPRTRIAAGARIHSGAMVGADCVVGADCDVMPNATLDARVRVGDRCVIHSGAVIGAEGFGFTPDEQGHWQAIAQLGGVVLGDDVSIGANTTIDRGALEDTVVGTGVKIDNLCQIGHNCQIGDHTLICGCVGIVGSTTVGKHCVLAGGCGIGGDGPVSVCDQVIISAMTLISQSITKPGRYSGAVLHAPDSDWKRNALRFRGLDGMHKRLRQLERDRQND
ncbi:MAG: UDP-3-O-(3-hydroxymyristoyl)glucosamine N-acyltransferase [Pseudomonadales bacterium]